MRKGRPKKGYIRRGSECIRICRVESNLRLGCKRNICSYKEFWRGSRRECRKKEARKPVSKNTLPGGFAGLWIKPSRGGGSRNSSCLRMWQVPKAGGVRRPASNRAPTEIGPRRNRRSKDGLAADGTRGRLNELVIFASAEPVYQQS